MFAVEHWIEESFLSLSEKKHFLPSKIVRYMETNSEILSIKWVSVPIASGNSVGVLLTSKKETQAKDSLCIMLHGLGENSIESQWHWASIFVEKGFPVLLIVWDGHGQKLNSVLDLATATRTLPLILQRLYGNKKNSNSTQQLPKCFLIGNSFGATLALLTGTRPECKNCLAGVIAISPMLTVKPSWFQFREFYSQITFSGFFNDLLPNFSLFGLNIFDNTSGRSKKINKKTRLRVGIDALAQTQAFLRENIDGRNLLSQLKVPVLWLHGAKDHIVELEKITAHMCSIPSAMFIHIDQKRSHRLMAKSREIAEYAANFVEKSSQSSFYHYS